MLSVENLELRVTQRCLVRALQWEINAGECWCVIGANGVGKSTLLHALAGLRTPDSGRVRLLGQDVRAWPVEQLAQRRALLNQAQPEAFGFSVRELVLTARHPYRDAGYWESEADLAAAHDALAALQIVHLAERDVRSLSGGERQRVALAAVLAQQTDLLLLDEPASALDIAHQVSTMRLIAALARQKGKAVVLVSHDLNLARTAASHALLLMGGGEWEAGPADDVMRAELLGRCLGHPIETVQSRGKTYFLPAGWMEEGP